MTTFNGQVSASTDDGYQNSTGSMFLTQGSNPIASTSGWGTAYRWLNVTVPNAAAVSACNISLYSLSSSPTGTLSLDFVDTGNPSTFATTTK